MYCTIVKRAELQDIQRLKNFYFQAYGDSAIYKYPERWNWQYRDNPFKEKSRLHVYFAENNNGVIVGHTAASRVNCKIFDKSVDLGWSVDTIVLPEHRGVGIGKLLQKINQDDHTLFASLSMTETNRYIKLKQGAKVGPSSRLYVYMLSFEKTFTSLLIRLVQKSKRKGYSSSPFDITSPESANFGKADTKLWIRIRNRYDFAVERDAEYLNWRYKMQPWTLHFCSRAYDERNELVGLIIYRVTEETTPKGAVILELLGDTSDNSVFSALLLATEKHLLKMGVTQVQVAVSDTIIEQAILSNGYIKVDENSLIIHGSKEITGEFRKKSVAMLTKGDQDWDEYPRANVFSHFGLIEHSKKNYNFKNINNIFLRAILNLYMFSLRLRSKK